MSRFWSSLTHDLKPYVPGEQPRMAELVKLNTNESPLGPSPRALEAIRGEATDILRLYPDPQAIANGLNAVVEPVVFSPLRKLGSAAIAGVTGDMFGSEAETQGVRLTLEATFIKLDAQRLGVQVVMKPSPPTPAETRALDQLLSTVRVSTPMPR